MTRALFMGVKVAMVVALGLSTVTGQAQQAVEFASVKTQSGCDIRVGSELLKIATGETKLTFAWDGACVGGVAQGLGNLRITVTSPDSSSVTSSRQTVNAGVPFGYFVDHIPTPAFAVGQPNPPAGIGFLHEGIAVFFTPGWGLSLAGLSVGDSVTRLPQQGPSAPVHGQSISTPGMRAVLIGSPCSLHRARLPSCATDEARKVYEITETLLGGDFMANMRSRKRTYCADPHSLASCAPLVEQIGAPMRAEILAFIERSKPSVDLLLAKVNASGPSVGAAPAAVATATVPPTAAASTVDLEKAPVGALFAAADEAAAKGDKTTSRAALRALIRRFPDHPLAATAAKQLAALQ